MSFYVCHTSRVRACPAVSSTSSKALSAPSRQICLNKGLGKARRMLKNQLRCEITLCSSSRAVGLVYSLLRRSTRSCSSPSCSKGCLGAIAVSCVRCAGHERRVEAARGVEVCGFQSEVSTQLCSPHVLCCGFASGSCHLSGGFSGQDVFCTYRSHIRASNFVKRVLWGVRKANPAAGP